ncbi:ABC transporter permease [Pararobbsia silviterrae]|uniref:ABC transporter permease n=1 Tax=Pararobbsia silviterrae TaxID=1792498 RepID=A0A494Y045_9BURK|nr:ABC transporter permease [Pararobbsia silviterrae]RKP53731.1 ABC transporter permease [Pararobbsia silviterrae]
MSTTVSASRRWVPSLSTCLLIASVILMLVIFQAGNARFLSFFNLLNFLRQSAVLLVVATGLTLVILIGSIDLSIGALVTFSAIATSVLLRDFQWPAWLAILAALGIGLVVGLVNGLLTVVVNIPSFIGTLGVMMVLGGVSVWMSGGQNVMFSNETMDWIASGRTISGIPNVALWAFAVFAVAVIVSNKTYRGRTVFATGSSTMAARIVGLNTQFIRLGAFMACSMLCSAGAVLMVARTSVGTPRMGDGMLLDAIAAVVIGGTALSGGSGGVHRTIFGVAIIALLKNGLNVIGVNPYLQLIITGAVVVIAVTMTLDRSRMAFVK